MGPPPETPILLPPLRKQMKLSSRGLSLLTVVLLAGVVVGSVHLRTRDPGGPTASSGASPSSPVTGDPSLVPGAVGQAFPTDAANPVTGAEVRRDTLWMRVPAKGFAEAMRRTTVNAQVTGRITSIPVRESSRVRAGDLLVQVDTTEYALALASARSGLLQAEAQYRELTLFDDQDPTLSASEREERRRFARARSGLDQREVEVRRAELDLERTSVRAPFDGYVADLEVVEGAWIGPGTELLTLVDIDPIKVEVNVGERQVSFIHPGQRARVTFAAFVGETMHGRVGTVNPVVGTERTVRVTLILPNPEGRIRPGMYADADIEGQAIPGLVLVPRSAILERDARTMVFVFEEGRAMWRYVTTGRENDEVVEIVEHPETDMVRPGEVVLTNGHQYLYHLAPVRLVENVAAEGGRPTR